MSREIKFRAWDIDWKKMVYPIGIDWDGQYGKDGLIIYYWVKAEGSRKKGIPCHKELLNIMQYTGLKDKNGKEIYEGDIYHQGDKYILYTVVWHDCCLIGKQNKSTSYAGIEHWLKRIEVIGNIYENPELLEVLK